MLPFTVTWVPLKRCRSIPSLVLPLDNWAARRATLPCTRLRPHFTLLRRVPRCLVLAFVPSYLNTRRWVPRKWARLRTYWVRLLAIVLTLKVPRWPICVLPPLRRTVSRLLRLPSSPWIDLRNSLALLAIGSLTLFARPPNER